MRIRLALLHLFLCAFALVAKAQTDFIGHVDSIINEHYSKSAMKHDTDYVVKPKQKWTIKLRANVSGTDLYAAGGINGKEFSSKMRTELKTTFGASVNYCGLSLGFALNPAKLTGRNKDYEFNLNSYGNRMGADLIITSSKTFRGKAESGGNEFDISPGQVSMSMIQGNVYYTFNHRRFSFPAAFSQSQVQKRSCGSWLLGLSAFGGQIDAGIDGIGEGTSVSLKTLCIGLGAGYGHNFAIRENWLLHLSTIPQIVVYAKSRMTVGGKRQQAPFKFPSIYSVGRFAVVRRFGNKFIGLSAVVNLWRQGDDDRLLLESVKWRGRLFYGFKF